MRFEPGSWSDNLLEFDRDALSRPAIEAGCLVIYLAALSKILKIVWADAKKIWPKILSPIDGRLKRRQLGMFDSVFDRQVLRMSKTTSTKLGHFEMAILPYILSYLLLRVTATIGLSLSLPSPCH